VATLITRGQKVLTYHLV